MAIIFGTPNDEQLLGTTSADELNGLDGNDLLEGRAGNDVLRGGYGNDTYTFSLGSGIDVISEVDGSGYDTIKLLEVFPEQIRLSRLNNDLVLQFTNSTDRITVTGFFDPFLPKAMIERIAFNDGTTWGTEAILNRVASNNSNVATEVGDTLNGSPVGSVIDGLGGNDTISGELGNDQIYGGTGNDSLFGWAGDDLLVGGDGNDVLRGGVGYDTLQGGLGNDTYVYTTIHNSDLIIEEGGFDSIYLNSTNESPPQTYDPLSLRLERNGNDLRLRTTTTASVITVQNHFNPFGGTSGIGAIEEIRFEDGTIWDANAIQNRLVANNSNLTDQGNNVFLGGAGAESISGFDGNDSLSGGLGNDLILGDNGNDRLFGNQGSDMLEGGAGDDSLSGNLGNDFLTGGTGDDRYFFNLGDGHDVVTETSLPGETNRVVFGEGISIRDLIFRQEGTDLVIEVAGTSDTLRLSNTSMPAQNAPHAVETLEFADGSVMNLSDPNPILGTPGSDLLYGTPENDLMDAQGGDDTVVAFAGNDRIQGGVGNDQLDGGRGDDTYIFAVNDGFDTIFEGTVVGPNGPEAGGTDTVVLTEGYDPATTLLQRGGNDLIIQNGQTFDQIIVRDHFGSLIDGSTRSAIERITFADGTIWDSEAIGNRIAQFNNNSPTESGDTIGGAQWSDYIMALGGNDTVSGGQGDDHLFGNAGNDRLFGGDGNDLLFGENGNDVLAGGKGNDTLDGGAGNDTYLFNGGDGVDRISNTPLEPGETNQVVFGEGIRFQHLTVSYYGDLVIGVGATSDQLILSNNSPDPNSTHSVNSFVFSDGTIATFAAVVGAGRYLQGSEFNDSLYGSWYADSLYGNGGDDFLFADNGDDILAGGRGNDNLSGGQGDDSYYFNRGDGSDFIDDNSLLPLEANRVVFGTGIVVDDVRLRTDGWTSWLEIAPDSSSLPGPIDMLRFSLFSPLDPLASRSVNSFEFSDGSTLSYDQLIANGFYIGGSESRDSIYGTDLAERIYGYGDNDEIYAAGGNDTLIGGTGSDTLSGGAGADTYVFKRGDGLDIIDEMAFPGEANRVVFGEGISLDDLHLITPNGDVYIEIGSPTDAILFAGYSALDTTGSMPVQSFVFADGSSISYSDLIARGYYIGGTGGNDTLSGYDNSVIPNDLIFGFGGNDVLTGGVGNDTLVGGTGNDLLYGGPGSDTYEFNLGDGSDTISDFALPGETNRVVFGQGISANDLSLQLDGNRLVVRIGWSGDQLSLDGFDRTNPTAAMSVDVFEFADGGVLSYAELVTTRNIDIYGTTGDDLINGTNANDYIRANTGNDIVYGFGGDDYLLGDYTGYSGNDILDGGDGNDTLYGHGGINTLIGGRGNDYFGVESLTSAVVENAGEGTDTVWTIISYYTLPENVENLHLGLNVIGGTGNELDNVILANGSSNILDGGTGIDTMYGYTGNDTYIVDNGADQAIEYSGAGNDTVLSSATYVLSSNIENLTLTGTGAINGTGNSLNNIMSGNSADNMLFGGTGADTLQGSGGTDTLLGGLGGDTYVYNLGDGNDSVFELESVAGDVDKVIFGSGITVQGLTVSRTGINRNDLQVAFAGNPDTLTVANWFNPAVPGKIEQFQFADGAVLTSQQMSDLSNSAPSVAQPLADQSVQEDSTFSFALPADAFADIDNDVLTLSATLADGSALPTWLSFDSFSRTFSGTPGNAEVGNLDIRVTATDPLGKSVSDIFALTVQNINDAPYYAGPIENQFGSEGQAFSYQLSTGAFVDSDVMHGDTLTYSATMFDGSPLPAWLNFDANTRTFSGTPVDGNDGYYSIAVSVTDEAGATASRVFDLSVYNSIIVGTNQADSLYGSLGDEKMYGLDGNDWIRASSGNDHLAGDAGNDRLFGGLGNDVFVGGTGDDYLYGTDDYPYALGSGNDTYLFGLGDGRDTILDVDSTVGNIDTIRLGTGISSSDVSFAGVNGNLIITVGTGGDQITVQNWFSPLSWFNLGYTEMANRIERLEFADGSVIDLTTRTDIVHTITGGTGNETIQAGIENNIISAGAGNDTVYAAAGFDLVHGDAGDDTLNGEAGNDTLYGDSGKDTLWGGDGDDVLAGGSEHLDLLYGGGGSDTYLFNLGDGQDTIIDYPDNAGDVDTLRFGAGITRNMLDIVHSTVNIGDVHIDVNGYDGVELYGWYYSPMYRIERLEFADGTSMTAAEIQAWADNVAPVVAMPVAAQSALEDAVFNFVLPAATFSDANAGDVLNYTATLADGSALPSWLLFDAATRSFSGTPTNDQVGTLSLRVTAIDSYGKSASTTFDLVVQNSNDAPTVANTIMDQTANEDTAFSFTVPANTFSDVDIGDSLTYSATLADGSALPTWLSFDTITSTFSGTPVNADVGYLDVVVTALDTGAAIASETFTLTIINTNDTPVLASPIADQVGAEGSSFSYVVPAATFSDVDTGDSLIYAATLADGSALPAWLSFNASTRTFTGNPADGTAGNYTVRVTATDGSGVSAFDDFVLTVADSIVTVRNGTSSAETLQGTAFRDTLNGLGGNDTLYGYAGNDTLDGGTGSDTMHGGAGDDAYVVNSSGDVVSELANEGIDSVSSSTTYTLSGNVENLTLTGSSSINGTGNSLDNVLTGNSGNNTLTGNAGNDWLDGGAGSDTMRGGAGNDTYVVSTSGDVVTESANEGTDTVRTSISYTLGNNVEDLTLTGAGTASGTGNSLNNVIFGNSASNTLTGNAGNDTLQGLGGNDTLRGGTGNDTYLFGRGDGADTISENDSTTGNQDTASLGVNVLDLVLSRSGNNLLLNLHGSTDTLTIQNWYTGTQYQTEVIRAQDGSTLANTQVANLIQAMATFSANNGGITWDQAIDQNASEVQSVLAGYWQLASG